MRKSFSKISTFIIFSVILCYCIVVALLQFACDSIMLATGKLTTASYTAADFTLKDLTPLDNGSYLTTSTDPQLIINDYNNYSTMIQLKFTTSGYPGEVNLYYTRGDEDFSNEQKIWGKARNDGTYEYVMPRGRFSKIRIDPASFSSLELNFESIVINPSRSFLSYFKPSGEDLFILLTTALLLSCLSKCIYESFYNELHQFGVKYLFKKKVKQDE